MKELNRSNASGEQRARVSDELRQLKQMSKGLRSKAMRALRERHGKRLETKPIVPRAKQHRPVAA